MSLSLRPAPRLPRPLAVAPGYTLGTHPNGRSWARGGTARRPRTPQPWDSRAPLSLPTLHSSGFPSRRSWVRDPSSASPKARRRAGHRVLRRMRPRDRHRRDDDPERHGERRAHWPRRHRAEHARRVRDRLHPPEAVARWAAARLGTRTEGRPAPGVAVRHLGWLVRPSVADVASCLSNAASPRRTGPRSDRSRRVQHPSHRIDAGPGGRLPASHGAAAVPSPGARPCPTAGSHAWSGEHPRGAARSPSPRRETPDLPVPPSPKPSRTPRSSVQRPNRSGPAHYRPVEREGARSVVVIDSAAG